MYALEKDRGPCLSAGVAPVAPYYEVYHSDDIIDIDSRDAFLELNPIARYTSTTPPNQSPLPSRHILESSNNNATLHPDLQNTHDIAPRSNSYRDANAGCIMAPASMFSPKMFPKRVQGTVMNDTVLDDDWELKSRRLASADKHFKECGRSGGCVAATSPNQSSSTSPRYWGINDSDATPHSDLQNARLPHSKGYQYRDANTEYVTMVRGTMLIAMPNEENQEMQLKWVNSEEEKNKELAATTGNLARFAAANGYFHDNGPSNGYMAATPPNQSSCTSTKHSKSRDSNSTLHPELQKVHVQNVPRSNGYQFHDANTGCTMMIVPETMMVAMPSASQEKQAIPAKLVKPMRKPSEKKDLRTLKDIPKEEITTLMVRGIPCSFSKDKVMELLDQNELMGKYDFFYLPMARSQSSNLGYAFINFVDHESAELCENKFHGKCLDSPRSVKICTISPADIQGLASLKKHFRRTAVSRGSCGPVFLKSHFQKKDSDDSVQLRWSL